MKYCWKCGLILNDTASFCERCGSAQNGGVETPVPPVTYSYHKTEEKADSNSLVAFIISLVTSPILFVIRLLGKETEMKLVKTWGGDIKPKEYTYLPDSVVLAMYVVLIISVLVVIALGFASKSMDKGKSLITKLLVIFNALFTLIITDIYVRKNKSNNSIWLI